jgi:hypothetical protein
MLYLLQLVQALRFESSNSEQRTSRSTTGAISHEDSGLADFLIGRAVANPILGNRFHWYLMVEVGMEDRVMAKMYARVDWNFMRKVEEVSTITCYTLSLRLLTNAHAVRRRTRASCPHAKASRGHRSPRQACT